MMITALVGSLLALAGTPQDAQNVERMQVRPMSETDAIGEFENACFSLRDPDALAHAASASMRNYVEAPAGSGAGALVRSWSSRYGTISYVERKPGNDGKSFRECSFTAYTRVPVNRFVLNRELGAVVARHADSHLVEVEDPVAMRWAWRDEQARATTLVSIADSKTPHQITLSLRSEDRVR